MKNLFIALGNLCVWFVLSFNSFFGILWYGKLPKKSFYHWNIRECSLFDLYNDNNCQVKLVEDVPDYIKRQIITDYINRLDKDIRFKTNLRSVNIPIFDGKDIIGSESVFGLLNDNI